MAPRSARPSSWLPAPEGQHYDYAVESTLAAAFYDVSLDLSPRLTLVHSARLEQLRYDYDNRMLAGNTRDDGTACGFGGCNYSRPEDRRIVSPIRRVAWASFTA